MDQSDWFLRKGQAIRCLSLNDFNQVPEFRLQCDIVVAIHRQSYLP